MKKIGIFGGSFNPPHKMHINIVLTLLNKHCVDKIYFVPTGSKYKYKSNLLSDKNRLDMLNIIANKFENVEVSDYELKDEVIYTCDTLAYFKEMLHDDEIYFICGTDNLSYVDKWKTGVELLKKYKFLVIDRKSNKIENLLIKYKEYKDNIIVAPVDLVDVSSTMIREKIKNGDDVSEYLDKDVLDYINENNLYRD